MPVLPAWDAARFALGAVLIGVIVHLGIRYKNRQIDRAFRTVDGLDRDIEYVDLNRETWSRSCCETQGMNQDRSLSDQLEERMIEFAARIISFATDLPQALGSRHIALQILRSGTAAAPNYAEARDAESRADFVHKLGIVQKELNETSVWLRILCRANLGKDDRLVALLEENVELARIVGASVRTAKLRSPK